MNEKEEARLEALLRQKLAAVDAHAPGVRMHLGELYRAANVNVPRRRRLEVVGEIASMKPFCDAVGVWVVAEVEGMDVQWNRLIGSLPEDGDNLHPEYCEH